MGTKSVYQKINDPLFCPDVSGVVEMLREDYASFFEKGFFCGLEEPNIFRQCPIEIQHASTFEIILLSLIMYSKTNEISGMLEVELRGFEEKSIRLSEFGQKFQYVYDHMKANFSGYEFPKIHILLSLYDGCVESIGDMCRIKNSDMGIFFAYERRNISHKVNEYCAKIGLKNYLIVEGF